MLVEILLGLLLVGAIAYFGAEAVNSGGVKRGNNSDGSGGDNLDEVQ